MKTDLTHLTIIFAVLVLTSNAQGQEYPPAVQVDKFTPIAFVQGSAVDGNFGANSCHAEDSLTANGHEPCFEPLGDCCEVPCWTGFYLGVDSGWGTSAINTQINPIGQFPVLDFTPKNLQQAANGAMFGGHLGFNWQTKKRWVFGVEGDLAATSISGTKNLTAISLLVPANGRDGFMATDKINWLASIRSRAGIARSSNFLYLTGGVAWEGINHQAMASANVGPGVFGVSAIDNFNKQRTGFVVGCGWERMLTAHWTLRGEYLFYGFNQSNVEVVGFIPAGGNPPPFARFATGANSINTLNVGLTYKF